MNVAEIIARRENLRAKQDAIETAHPDLVFPDDVQAQLTAIEAEAAALNAAEKRAALFADHARTAPARPLSGTERPELRVFEGGLSPRPEGWEGRTLRSQTGDLVPLLTYRDKLSSFLPPEQRSEVGLGEFLRAMYFGARNEIERRVLAEGSIGTGGAMVPAPLSAMIIEALVAQAVSMKAGAVMIPMTSQTLAFARVVSLPVGSFRAENSPITEDQPAFDRVTLAARSWALLVRMSRELLEDGVNTSETIQNVIGQAAGLAVDSAVLFGSGAPNNPTGIANTTGVQTVPGGGLLTNYTEILDAVEALEAANSPTVTAMVMAPRTARQINGFINSLADPMTIPPRLAGIPQYSTTSVPITGGSSGVESQILLGNFGTVAIGMRTQLQVSQLLERYADQGQVGFVAWLRMDVQLAHPAAMAKITGITP